MHTWSRKVLKQVLPEKQPTTEFLVYTCGIRECLAGKGTLQLSANDVQAGSVLHTTTLILRALSPRGVTLVMLWLNSDEKLVGLPVFFFQIVQNVSVTDWGVISLTSRDPCGICMLIDIFCLISTVAVLLQLQCTVRAKLCANETDHSFICDLEITDGPFCILVASSAGRIFHSEKHKPVVSQLQYKVGVACACYRYWRPYAEFLCCCKKFRLKFNLTPMT
jgi:hypothetical protein